MSPRSRTKQRSLNLMNSLGCMNFVQIFAFEEVIDEVTSNPDDMLFDEGFAIDVS